MDDVNETNEITKRSLDPWSSTVTGLERSLERCSPLHNSRMKILILGGTQFIGRHLTLAFLAAGHTVSVLTRGLSPDDLPPEVERLRGDRDGGPAGLQALSDRTWDACIDVSGYTPRQVRPSAELLRIRVLASIAR